SRSAPRLNDVSRWVELDNRWRRHTALRALWRQRGAAIGFIQRARPLEDPDMVLSINRHPPDLADDPIVGELLWPAWVDFEFGAFRGRRQCCENSHGRKHRNKQPAAKVHDHPP